jgi:hypothetical protein
MSNDFTTWTCENKTERTFNESDQITSYAFYYWDYSKNRWLGNYKTETIYNISGIKDIEMEYYMDNTFQWQISYKYKYLLNSFDEIGIKVQYVYDNKRNEWLLEGKYYYYYSLLHNNIDVNFNNENSLIIYPNPSNGIFNLVTKIHVNQLHVYNSFGQQIKTYKILFGYNSYNISDLKTGLYFIQIPSEKGIIVKKLFKQ